jgi:Alginate lyase
MNNKMLKNILFAVLFVIATQSIFAQTPRVFVLNSKLLSERKAKIFDKKSPDLSFKTAIDKLENEAKKTLKVEIRSIVTKEAVPPSGDKHDYVSQAPYFWKNPKTADGFPYIRKDGERNPEIKRFPDHDLLDDMVAAVEKLSTAYYFTNKEEYAAKAGEILRMWFVDAKTKMNPNLEFAQAIPGVNTGRGIGIIETGGLTRVVDSIGLLEGAKSWTSADQKGLEEWFDKYLTWLTKSKNGVDEALAKNNHGTIYDVQLVSFALFAGKKDFAKKWLEGVTKGRIATQIEVDGRMPLELERTKSWNYSTMNLEGFVTLAELGENVGIDLWNFQTKDGRGIRKAIEFLYPFLNIENKWKYEQIEGFEPERLFPIMRRAATKYSDDKFIKMMLTVPKSATNDKNSILYQ